MPPFARSSMPEALGKLYMRAVAAKGAPRNRRILRRALPNAAITILGLNRMDLKHRLRKVDANGRNLFHSNAPVCSS